MVNRCESLINVVKSRQAKEAERFHQKPRGLSQKAQGQEQRFSRLLSQMTHPRRTGET
jgi:hypothetical protein